jgi:membrane-associated protein
VEIFSSIMQLITDNAQYAHWLIFGVLILAGLNVPISEDLMLVTSGVLASTVVPENTTKLFVCVFLGCYLSDWIAYWIGRRLGPKLWKFKWFASMVSEKRFQRMKVFYQDYGFLTLLVGRFIPFGVRNCLFITAGMTRMHFGKFIISDGIACFISNTALFTLAYSFGKNHEVLFEYLRTYNLLVFGLFVALLTSVAMYFLFKKFYYTQGERA